MRRLTALVLTVLTMFSLCGCRKETKFSMDDFADHRDTVVRTYSFCYNVDYHRNAHKSTRIL